MSGSRFVAPDLSVLPDLPLVDVDFEATETRRIDFIKASFEKHGIPFEVENLETDPARIAYAEGGGFNEMLIDQRINNAMRALSLATADEVGLRHIGATYSGISQQETTNENGEIIREDAERFRSRIQLAPEAFSTAGPEGAYLFHSLELDGVQDIADVNPLGHENGAVYSDDVLYADAHTHGKKPTPFDGRASGDPVLPAEVLIAALPSVEYGPIDQALIDRVWVALSARDVRPLADAVRVEAAVVIDYEVNVEVTYQSGADPTILKNQIIQELEEYVAARRKVGLASEIHGIGGQAYIANTESVNLISPTADVGGGQKEAPNCTGITVTLKENNG